MLTAVCPHCSGSIQVPSTPTEAFVCPAVRQSHRGTHGSRDFYTSPWEDDDNEYGYWNCPCCNAINIDWDSGDD